MNELSRLMDLSAISMCERYQHLLLALGMATGGLADEAIRDEMARSIRSGELDARHLERLRDLLDRVLASGRAADATATNDHDKT